MNRDPIPLTQSGGVSDEDRAQYFKSAQSWSDDRIQKAERSTRTAHWLAGALLLGLILALSALVLMIPLQKTETVVVRVDASTGIVDDVVRLTNARQDYDEVVTEYFLRKYVTSRESYTRNQINRDYTTTSLMTDEKLRDALRTEFLFETPGSLYQQFGENGTRSITIKSTAKIGPNVYQVRFVATDKKLGVEQETHFIATIAYEYRERPTQQSVRSVTPLGFVVTSYRRDIEAIAKGDNS